MIIAIDVSQIVYKTGVSRYTRELVNQLLKIDTVNTYKLFAGVFRQSDEIDAFFSQLSSFSENFRPYKFLFPPTVADLIWNRFHRVSIEHFIGKADVLHTSNWAQPPSRAVKVTTIHDLTPILYPQHHTQKIIENFQHNLEWIHDECCKVITDSAATKEDIIKHTSIEETAMRVIHLAADAHFEPVADAEAMRKKLQDIYHIPGKYILSVGTREPRKNVKRLIDAYLASGLPEKGISLVLTGKAGWGDQNIPSHRMLLETGFVPDDDLPSLYSGAEAFAYVSEYEGFGLPVLEAMQCGCPVITSNCSSMAEIAGNSALLIDPMNTEAIKQALEKVISDIKTRNALINKGLKRAKEFSWEKTARATLQVYEEVVDTV